MLKESPITAGHDITARTETVTFVLGVSPAVRDVYIYLLYYEVLRTTLLYYSVRCKCTCTCITQFQGSGIHVAQAHAIAGG